VNATLESSAACDIYPDLVGNNLVAYNALGRPADSVQPRRIKQNRALDVSASERLRANHNFAICCNACQVARNTSVAHTR
jgi:hypothetical protein